MKDLQIEITKFVRKYHLENVCIRELLTKWHDKVNPKKQERG